MECVLLNRDSWSTAVTNHPKVARWGENHYMWNVCTIKFMSLISANSAIWYRKKFIISLKQVLLSWSRFLLRLASRTFISRKVSMASSVTGVSPRPNGHQYPTGPTDQTSGNLRAVCSSTLPPRRRNWWRSPKRTRLTCRSLSELVAEIHGKHCSWLFPSPAVFFFFSLETINLVHHPEKCHVGC